MLRVTTFPTTPEIGNGIGFVQIVSKTFVLRCNGGYPRNRRIGHDHWGFHGAGKRDSSHPSDPAQRNCVYSKPAILLFGPQLIEFACAP